MVRKPVKADTPKTYRLVELRAINVKKLKAVAVRIDGTVLKVSGRNEQGKSSLLDAVAMAIGGPEAFPKVPIRKGEEKAEIFLDFGGLKLTRRLWQKEGGGVGQDVTIEYADGKRPKQKQTVLDELRGSPIADDPIEFATKLKPRERFDMLKTLVPDYDFEIGAAQRQSMYEDRTIVGRDLERAKGAAESVVLPPGKLPTKSVDITDLGKQLQDAINHNQQIAIRAKRREEAADELETMRDEADQMAASLKKLQDDIAAREKQLIEAEDLPAPIDRAAIEARIDSAESVNALCRLVTDKAEKEHARDELEAKYDGLSKQIENLDRQKNEAISRAKLPIPELTFGDDDILLDGLPFDQASTARKIRVSTALLMALKPQLRVLLVREGSLLDDEARAALEADAAANDFVVLMECVGDGGGDGIVIENGEIV
jgi:hypothetical protein